MPVSYYVAVGLIVLIQVVVLVQRNMKPAVNMTPKCCSNAMSRIGIHYVPRSEGLSAYQVESVQTFKCGGCHRVQVVTTKVFEHQNRDVANKVMEQLEGVPNPQSSQS